MILAVALTRRLTEGAYVLGGIGALVTGWGALSVLRGFDDRERERRMTAIGSVLIAAAFFVLLYAMVSAPKSTTPKITPSPTPSATASPS